MKERCNNENSKSYKNYGWRWITYDPKWGKFEWFYEDMWPIYKDWLTIERVDVNKNYCKANCEWISKSKQSQNTRRTVYITYNWITDTVRWWSERLWLKYITFKKRYYRNRYNLDKVIY